MAVLDTLETFAPIREKIEAGERLDFEDGVALMESDDLLALGIAFQIADDVLDCSGATIETGKIAGTDLRDGTPTLPLLLAAQEDAVVRNALAGGPLDGALVRVAATGALERSLDVALDYASRARACLNGELHRGELETLTHVVVNRER